MYDTNRTENNAQDQDLACMPDVSACRQLQSGLFLQATLKDLQTTLKIAKTKEAASLPKEAKSTPLPPASRDLESGVQPDEHQALLAQQQQQQQQERSVLESRLQYNDALIDERDEGIQDIQRNIQDIQEMFQVWRSLVNSLRTPCAQTMELKCMSLLPHCLVKLTAQVLVCMLSLRQQVLTALIAIIA